MRSQGAVKVIIYYPKDEDGKSDLAVRVAQVHSDVVMRRIKELNCPDEQKRILLDAVIDDVKKRGMQEKDNALTSDNRKQSIERKRSDRECIDS